MSGKVVQSEREVQDSKVTRNQAIELLRIMSAFGIVAYHGGAPFRELAYAGLVIFLILAPATDLRFNWNRARSIS